VTSVSGKRGEQYRAIIPLPDGTEEIVVEGDQDEVVAWLSQVCEGSIAEGVLRRDLDTWCLRGERVDPRSIRRRGGSAFHLL